MTTTGTGGRFYRQRLLVYWIPRIECASCMACIHTSAKSLQSLQSRFGVEGALPHRHITSLAVVQRCVVVSPHVPSGWASLHSWTSATPSRPVDQFATTAAQSGAVFPGFRRLRVVIGVLCHKLDSLVDMAKEALVTLFTHLCRSRFRFVFQAF
jgi:hypothetical protein